MWYLIWLSCTDGKIELEGGTGYIIETQTDENGIAYIEIDIANNKEHFLLTSEAKGWVSVNQIYNPNGTIVLDWEDWFENEESLTGAIWSGPNNTVINWPIRQADGKLKAGTWTVAVGLYDDNGQPKIEKTVTSTVQTKKDSKLSTGNISVTLVYAEGVEEQEEVSEAVEGAVDRWKEIWEPYGLTLDIDYDNADIPADIPKPELGHSSIKDISEDGDETDILVIVGESIEGSSEYYGIAGSIPGSIIATNRSAVVISWLAHAGTDGVFDEEDIRIFGETLAHEVSHYIGLFHPVEVTFGRWDALEDTPNCTAEDECHEEMAQNLMFPYPICTLTACTAQQDLSDDQQGVLHRYVGVR